MTTTRDSLSHRERQVAALAVRGWSDIEIAGALHVTYRTVRTHIEHIYNKLGVNRRIELARVIRRNVLESRRHGEPHRSIDDKA